MAVKMVLSWWERRVHMSIRGGALLYTPIYAAFEFTYKLAGWAIAALAQVSFQTECARFKRISS